MEGALGGGALKISLLSSQRFGKGTQFGVFVANSSLAETQQLRVAVCGGS